MNLHNFELPDDSKIEIIDNRSFDRSSIERLLIPPNVTKICECAFSYCKKLKKIAIHHYSKLKFIDHRAFEGSSIESINIPFSVEHIGFRVFDDCDNLLIIEFENYDMFYAIDESEFISHPKTIFMISLDD